MRLRYILYLIGFLITGCISPFEFEFENDANNSLLVVDGIITQKDSPHELSLRYSASYGSVTTPVKQAKVTLYDENGNHKDYIEMEDGKYVLFKNTIPRNPGNSYFIEIRLFNGKKYRSRSQIMPEVMKPEKIYYDLVKREKINVLGNFTLQWYLNIYISTPVTRNNQKSFFRWRVDHVYSFREQCASSTSWKTCYIKRKLTDDIKNFSSENLSGGFLEGFIAASLLVSPTWEFNEKHFYNVAQHSITKEAYKYWETVNKIAQPTGSIFDTPPAHINGNIYNIDDPDERVLGFFEVSAVNTIRTYTYAHDLEPLYIRHKCSIARFPDPTCCNCLTIPDSDLERPHYWDYRHNE
jgi:hypothetical protein